MIAEIMNVRAVVMKEIVVVVFEQKAVFTKERKL